MTADTPSDKSHSASSKSQPAQQGKAPAAPAGKGAPATAGKTVPVTKHSVAPPVKPPPPPVAAAKVPGLFRRIDWLTFFITFAAVWIGYYLTLAPELTLEDSGELATGSFYAGIPHPPGYPVWTIYTWLWTVLVPFKNIAWRVALGEATGGALAAGFLGLLVSRGSSLLMEGIEELKEMTGRWGSGICLVSGFVAGMLIGYNGFMWSQSVIVEVYSFSVASLMVVLLCLLRWIYAPSQRRWLYYALFFHGICFTNHQTLIVAAMGIEVAIAAADFRMGRSLWLGNTIVYFAGLFLKSQHILTALDNNQAVLNIFHVVGMASLVAYLWFAFILTKETVNEFALDACLAGTLILWSAIPAGGIICGVLSLLPLAGLINMGLKTRKLGSEWLVVVVCGGCWVLGAAFYFYMPLAGMSNPPMEWGYPRTVEGFVHAFTRGQYEKANPTDIIGHPDVFLMQLRNMGAGIVDEFNWSYVFVALIPFLFFKKLHRRERAWLIGVAGIYLCLGVLLLILLNPPPDRAAQELNRVFFTASHTLIALLVGYGLTLIAAYMATHYQRFRPWGLLGGAIVTLLGLLSFVQVTQEAYFGEESKFDFSSFSSLVASAFTNKDQYGLPIYAGLILISLGVVFVASLLLYKKRAPLAITLGLFALMPLHPILTHWADNEQRDHWFGYWFGHDMFTPPFKGSDGKPLYPEMTRDAILFGGTDPGRFCPTYTIFCDSFLPHNCQPAEDQKFDRRDVYIITQNALADGTYLDYIRAQYNRSTQIDPPFFQDLFRSEKERTDNYRTNALALAMRPLDRFFIGMGDHIEEQRRTFTSWFTTKDFVDLNSFAGKLRAQQDAVSKYIYENLSPATQQLVAGGASDALARGLVTDLNHLLERELVNRKELASLQAEKSGIDEQIAEGSASSSRLARQHDLEARIAQLSQGSSLYDTNRFRGVAISEYLQDFINENPQSHTRIRLNRLLLEAAYPKEIAHSIGGVYPDREIYTPTPDDSQRCFQDYLADAQRRLQANQLKPGEDVKIVENRVQVSGQVAVMSINGLLTKVIFDHNPKNEFFVEESFPLDWMYPYLTPFGIIMKINRQQVSEITDDMVRRDHEFWMQYSKRLVGDWLTYDTSIADITKFVEKVYLRRDFSGFTGDRKFIRDDQAQKAFSKLRSSIGGIYAYRLGTAKPGTPEYQRMLKEADFTFRQSFAFCPYSPEAVFRYVNLLLSQSRFDDAYLIGQTCLKLDPFNGQMLDLVAKLENYKKERSAAPPMTQNLTELEKDFEAHPTNFQLGFDLAAGYLQTQQTNKATAILEGIVRSPQANPNAMITVATAFKQLGNLPALESSLERLSQLAPDSPEAWFDLAGVKAITSKTQEMLRALAKSVQLSQQRLRTDPKARNTAAEAQTDPRFEPYRSLPAFSQALHR